jgi:beta-lactamase class A
MKLMKWFGVILLVLVLITVTLKSFEQVSAKDSQKTNSTSDTKSAKTVLSSNATAVTSSINSVIADDPDGLSTAVSIIDLNSNQDFEAGATTTLFKAASTAKILAAIDYLHEVEEGQASLDQQIDGTAATQLIQQMIEVSDDNAWADIDNYLGDQQQNYANQLGLSSFTGGEYNTMTSSDMAKLLAMFYRGKLLDNTDQSLLLGYMANTTSTNLIQAVLPPTATVYHKYGQLWGYLNDAAIVNYQGHQYALVIFTNNQDGTTDEYNDQVNLIQQISRLVFQDILDGQA